MPVTDPYQRCEYRNTEIYHRTRFITIAIQIQAVVVGWQVYELTKDPLSLGLIGLAEAVPSIVVSLLGAGHVADFVHRKKIIVITVFALLVAQRHFWFLLTTPERLFFSGECCRSIPWFSSVVLRAGFYRQRCFHSCPSLFRASFIKTQSPGTVRCGKRHQSQVPRLEAWCMDSLE